MSNYSSDATDKAGPLLGKLIHLAGIGALLAPAFLALLPQAAHSPQVRNPKAWAQMTGDR